MSLGAASEVRLPTGRFGKETKGFLEPRFLAEDVDAVEVLIALGEIQEALDQGDGGYHDRGKAKGEQPAQKAYEQHAGACAAVTKVKLMGSEESEKDCEKPRRHLAFRFRGGLHRCNGHLRRGSFSHRRWRHSLV